MQLNVCLFHFNEIFQKIISIFFLEFLCHSQNTERFVKVVSESALAVTDENRIPHILAKLESSGRYSKLDSPKNFV